MQHHCTLQYFKMLSDHLALVTRWTKDRPSVVRTACEVSQPRRLHAVQVYRPLSSFFTRWMVKVRFCRLRITPVNNTSDEQLPQMTSGDCKSCRHITWALHHGVVVLGPHHHWVWPPGSITVEGDCCTHVDFLIGQIVEDPCTFKA